MTETYSEVIASQLERFLDEDEMALILGVGVADSKGIFGTTLKSRLRFPERVLETPLSENALTGACVGLALEGHTPILVHARTDFLTLSAEHLVNSGAKWNTAHQSNRMGRVIVRAIQGRGWGQGPQHSQNLSTMFLNVPGISVWMPVTREGYSKALHDSSASVILIIEPRRLYDKPILNDVGDLITVLDTQVLDMQESTIFAYGDTILDAIEAQKILKSQNIDVDVFSIEHVSSIFFDARQNFSLLPKMAVICESSPPQYGLSSELALSLSQNNVRVERVSPPFTPCPTSLPLETNWYPQLCDILTPFVGEVDANRILEEMNSEKELAFTGPF
jgi:pyruvate/2-oxoglutarate/acetoin dehydrogenase E1 component